jgi:hypothetical protein
MSRFLTSWFLFFFFFLFFCFFIFWFWFQNRLGVKDDLCSKAALEEADELEAEEEEEAEDEEEEDKANRGGSAW